MEQPAQVEAGETLDLFAGTWRIFQLAKGHRFSTDDLATAWLAARVRPNALTLLDLGAGIGSVGLMTLWRMAAGARLVQVEAQVVSHQLARKTVAYNALQDRVTSRLGDLRDPEMVPELGAYDLVTGSPPYFPEGAGLIPKQSQRAHARFELRGDVFDYCRAAARAMAPGGAFVFCHVAGDPRPERAIAAAGLALRTRIDVCFRAGQPPTIALFAAEWTGPRLDGPTLTVRDESGANPAAWNRLRAEMGAPIYPSPVLKED